MKQVFFILFIPLIGALIIAFALNIPVFRFASGEVGAWISFWGSYGGALIGAVMVYMVTRYQIKSEREGQRENYALQLHVDKAEKFHEHLHEIAIFLDKLIDKQSKYIQLRYLDKNEKKLYQMLREGGNANTIDDLNKFREEQNLSVGNLVQIRIQFNETILKMQRYHALVRRYEIIFEQNKANGNSLDLFKNLKSNINEIIECFEESLRENVDEYVEIDYKPFNTSKDGVTFMRAHSSFSMEVKLPIGEKVLEYNKLIRQLEDRLIFPTLQLPTKKDKDSWIR